MNWGELSKDERDQLKRNDFSNFDSLCWMKVGDPKIERLYKMEFDRAMGNDNEQKQMEKAFTYGMALNRQGLKPIKSIREVMREHFEMMEHRRLLYTLRFRKGNSVCGEREPCIIRKIKQ